MTGGVFCRISVVRAVCNVSISEPTFVGTTFHLQVEHSLFLAIIYTCNTFKITIFIIEFNLIYNIGRNIFKSHILVGTKEVLTFHQNTIHCLSVYGNCSVVRNFHSGILFQQFLEHGACRHTERRRVIHHSILGHRNRRNLGCNNSLF